MAAFDDKYFTSFKEALLELEADKDEILEVLPSDMIDGYEEFMEKLLVSIEEEIETLFPMLEETSDKEDLEYLNNQCRLLSLKKSVIEEKLSEVKTEDINVPVGKKNLLFLMSEGDRPLVERDAKDISDEYLPSFGELIKELREYNLEFNRFDDTVSKKMTNHEKLKEVFEMKKFKVRLYYIILDEDTFLVLMGAYKNQNNPKWLTESLVTRLISSKPIVARLKKELQNPEKKEAMVEEHRQIADDLIEKYIGCEKGKSYE